MLVLLDLPRVAYTLGTPVYLYLQIVPTYLSLAAPTHKLACPPPLCLADATGCPSIIKFPTHIKSRLTPTQPAHPHYHTLTHNEQLKVPVALGLHELRSLGLPVPSLRFHALHPTRLNPTPSPTTNPTSQPSQTIAINHPTPLRHPRHNNGSHRRRETKGHRYYRDGDERGRKRPTQQCR